MATSQSFEGMRFSIKVDMQTFAHLRKEARGNARETIARNWLHNWRTLCGLPVHQYQQLIYAAQQRRLSLPALVAEALSKYCATLPPVPEGVRVETPIDQLDETDVAAQEPEAAEVARRTRKKSK